MDMTDILDLIKEVWPKVKKAYRLSSGRGCPVSPSDLKVAVSSRGVLPGKIGRHIGPKDGYTGGSLLILHPKVFQVNKAYVKAVVAHELIHFSLSRDKVPAHGTDFNAIAGMIGLPVALRD